MKTTDSYLSELKSLYQKHGITVLSSKWLRENRKLPIYNALQSRKMTSDKIAAAWEISNEWKDFEREIEFERRRKITAKIRTSACTSAPRVQLPVSMSKSELLGVLRSIYDKFGIEGICHAWLDRNGYPLVTERLRKVFDTTLAEAADDLGLANEYENELLNRSNKMVASRGQEVWTVERVHATSAEIVQKFKTLPSTRTLIANGYSSFLTSMHKFKIKYEDLKIKYGITDDQRKTATNGVLFDSIGEACLANFLLARGIQIQPGKIYPKEYSEMTGKAYGIYDLHFLIPDGESRGKWADVEIFGGAYFGDIEAETKYARTKSLKQQFNKDNPLFIELDVADCYDDRILQRKLELFIGNPAIETDSIYRDVVQSNKYSLAEATVSNLRLYCHRLGIQTVPLKAWFDRKGDHLGRVRYDWEVKGITRDINTLGGYNKVRQLMNIATRQDNEFIGLASLKIS